LATGRCSERAIGEQDEREVKKATFTKCLKLRGFQKAGVNWCVLVRISTGELGTGSKGAEAGVYGKTESLFPFLCDFSRELASFGPNITLSKLGERTQNHVIARPRPKSLAKLSATL
jgi:hypothetical protein